MARANYSSGYATTVEVFSPFGELLGDAEAIHGEYDDATMYVEFWPVDGVAFTGHPRTLSEHSVRIGHAGRRGSFVGTVREFMWKLTEERRA